MMYVDAATHSYLELIQWQEGLGAAADGSDGTSAIAGGPN